LPPDEPVANPLPPPLVRAPPVAEPLPLLNDDPPAAPPDVPIEPPDWNDLVSVFVSLRVVEPFSVFLLRTVEFSGFD
jgi:hypothetical protein